MVRRWWRDIDPAERYLLLGIGCALVMVLVGLGFPIPAHAYYVKHPGGSWDYAVVLSRPGYPPSMRSVMFADETTAAPALYVDENAFIPTVTEGGEVAYLVPPAVPSSGYYGWASSEAPSFNGSICPTITGAKGGYFALYLDHMQTFQRDATYGYWVDGLGLDFGKKNGSTSASGRYVSASWGPGQNGFGSYSPAPSRQSTPTPSQRWKAEAWAGLMVCGVRNADGGMRSRWNAEAAVYDPQGYHESIPEHGQRNLWTSVDESAPIEWLSWIQSTSSLPSQWRFAPVQQTNKFPWSTTGMMVLASSELNTETAQAFYGKYDVDLYASVISSQSVAAAAAGGVAGVSKEESGTTPSEITSTTLPAELGLPTWLSMWANDKVLKPLRDSASKIADGLLFPVTIVRDTLGGQ